MNSEARLGREPTSTLMTELETTIFLQVVMGGLYVPLPDQLDLADTTDLALVGVCICIFNVCILLVSHFG